MKIIVIIERPAVIRQIRKHLGLATAAPSFHAPNSPDGLPADPSREWAYKPAFDHLLVLHPVFA